MNVEGEGKGPKNYLTTHLEFKLINDFDIFMEMRKCTVRTADVRVVKPKQ